MSGSYVGKTLAVILATAFIVHHSHAQSGGYAITERGADYKVLQKTTVENGTNRVHKYTELATGMNYTNAYGQLVESKEQITILSSGGAAAVQGQHKVYFPSDIYNGVLEVVTPDGKHLRSRPLGVSYDDGSNTVFIAQLKHALGYLVSSNKVVYRDAFTDFKADLVCTYRRDGFENDLVFRQQPPAPGDYGLDADWSTLQMVTEFFNTPDPEEIPSVSNEWYGLEDSTLKFGRLTMTQGRAFAMNPSGTNSSANIAETGDKVPVYKRWLHLDSRTFLIEEVPLEDLAEDLDALPLTASSQKPASSNLKFATNKRQFPPSHDIVADTNQMLLASIDLNREPGVVLDYVTTLVGWQTNQTFNAGTYYVNGPVYIYGYASFNPGAIVKFARNTSIAIPPNATAGIVCYGSLEQPVVFTAKDDNTVGDSIDGSTGNPTGYYASPALSLGAANPAVSFTFSNVCIAYASQAVVIQSAYPSCRFYNARLINCGAGVNKMGNNTGVTAWFRNCLFNNVQIPFNNLITGQFVAQNTTFAGCANLMTFYPGMPIQYQVSRVWCTNCVFANVTNSGVPVSFFTADYNGFFNSPTFGTHQQSSAASPFTSAAAASYYLAAGSPFHDAGTTVIDATLLAELQTMTTYAPQDGGMPDTNAPDLGYHYSVNEDSDHDGLPDWWEWKYFDAYSMTSTNLDSSGRNTLGYDYTHYLDPNIILFNAVVTNNHVNTSYPNVRLVLAGGFPAYYAVLVNDTNQADAVWWPYTGSNVVAVLGADGRYQVSVGLRGFATNATVTWAGVTLTKDTVPPVLTITNPVANTVTVPMIQVQGFSPEALQGVSCSVSNSAGTNTSLFAMITSSSFDTNSWVFATNGFQVYDIPLAVGPNILAVRATDLAGNVTTTNLNVMVDYSGATNPPVPAVVWPASGTPVGGSNFTLQAQINDPSATVTVTIVDASGHTNIVPGVVGRNGQVMVNQIPLSSGASVVTVTTTSAAGLSSATSFSVTGQDVGLTIAPLSGGQLNQSYVSASGSIGNSSYAVTVNGVAATVAGDGNWVAYSVPVSDTGTASFQVEVRDGNGNLIAAQAFHQAQPVVVTTASQEFRLGMEPYLDGGSSCPLTTWDLQTEEWLLDVGGVYTYFSANHSYDCVERDTYRSYELGPEESEIDDGWGYAETRDPGGWHYNNQPLYRFKHLRTRLALAPGGDAGQGTTVTYLVQAQASEPGEYHPNTYRELPAEWLQINGQALVQSSVTEAGVIWGATIVQAPAGVPVDVTPEATQVYDNWQEYYFDVQASEVNLQLAVDNNRDGDITFDSADQTAADKPYRFWVNNDYDGYDSDIVDYVDLNPATSSDADNTSISCQRDLEDHSRLWINTQGITEELKNGTFVLALEWQDVTGDPQIRVFQAAETNGGTLYLTDTSTAQMQTNASYGNAIVDRAGQNKVSTYLPFMFPTNAWASLSADKPVAHLLFDAVSRGSGKLVVAIYKNYGLHKLAEGAQPLYLKLQDVKEMYERWTVDNNGAVATTASLMTSPYSYDSSITAENNYILFVHGWNLAPWERDAFAETAFKRLYWQGYIGHFGAFQWPTLTGATTFDTSELIAWQSAVGLRKKLTDLNGAYPGNVYLMAHSMGNVVAGEALKQSGSNQVVNTYVAMQAAIASHAYDPNADSRALTSTGFNLDDDTPNRFANYYTNGAPCYFNGNAGAATFVNFYNINDWALTTLWQPDQDAKPDTFRGYAFDPVAGQFFHDSTELIFPFDRYEIFSACDEARCYALGTQAGVGGVFQKEGVPQQVNLSAIPYSFGTQHKDHSGEFNSDNMNRWTFWEAVLEKFGITN